MQLPALRRRAGHAKGQTELEERTSDERERRTNQTTHGLRRCSRPAEEAPCVPSAERSQFHIAQNAGRPPNGGQSVKQSPARTGPRSGAAKPQGPTNRAGRRYRKSQASRSRNGSTFSNRCSTLPARNSPFMPKACVRSINSNCGSELIKSSTSGGALMIPKNDFEARIN